MKHHAIIVSGASITYPVGKGVSEEDSIYESGNWQEMPARGTGAHRIASHLRQTSKWDVEVLDFLEAWSDEELREFVDSRVHSRTKWIGFSVFFTYAIYDTPPIVHQQNKLISYIKHRYPRIKIIVGANKLVNVIRHQNVDYFSIGNGEHAIVALCDYFTGDAPHPKTVTKVNPFNIPELENQEYVIMDCFRDYPAFPHKNPHTSYEERDFIRPEEVLTIELARGCIFKCTFCDYSPLGIKGDFTRDADNFEAELKENYRRWGTTHYILTDETTNDSSKKIEKFANVVRGLSFQPQFHGFVRADLLTIRAKQDWDNMIDMGLTSMAMGIETFNHESGKSIKKGFSPLQLQEGLIASREYFKKNRHPENHYNQTLTMIAGLPHETFESLDNTGTWLNTYWPNQITFHPLYISQHVNDGIDAYSDIEGDPAKYGYTWRDRTDIDRVIENYYHTHWEVKKVIKKKSMQEMRDMWEPSTTELHHQQTWVHPSGEYDYIDMLMWTTHFQSDRIVKLGRPESVSGWHMGWYRQLGFDTQKIYEDIELPDITEKDINKYYGFLEQYKKDKLNWYK